MKKYVGCLIILLLIFVPRTNSKYVLSDAKNLGVTTPGFDVVETTNGPVEIMNYKNEYIEITLQNNTKKEILGDILIDGVKFKTINLEAGKKQAYKIYLTESFFNKLVFTHEYTVKINYMKPYKASSELTTVKKIPYTIYRKVKDSNLGNDKTLGIDYSKISSSTNGEGVYLFDETKNEANPVYYYRGTHNLNNNLIYGGICWKIVRTTETNGVRVVYNGNSVGGKCSTTTGDTTQIGTSSFNIRRDRDYAGYMYGNVTNPNDNINDSNVKKFVDDWYKINIKDRGFEAGLDKQSTYCGNRDETEFFGSPLYMSGYKALDHLASMKCPINDSYGVNGGNKKLIYPVGLLTYDDLTLAGMLLGYNENFNINNYLYTNKDYWLISPLGATGNDGYIVDMFQVVNKGSMDSNKVGNNSGVRPAITLKGELPVYSGNGSKDNPFVIKLISKEIASQSLGNDKEKGIDYNKVNSPTNGEGVYLFDETKHDAHPVYFFRGTHNLKNNLLYANFCWKIVRTTETGGVRIIYNGAPVNGKCTTTTGSNTQIGTSRFNPTYDKKKHVGYMFGDDTNPYQNTNDSNIKKYIDNWYKTNIKDNGFESSLDKKAIYCGDRTEGTDKGSRLQYAGLDRGEQKKPSLKCSNNDSYGLESGNRKLKYPVGLLSVDDIYLAGGKLFNNSNYYLYTDEWYWLLSPSAWLNSISFANVLNVQDGGYLNDNGVANSSGVRPALTISSSAILKSGDGSQNNPYVI